MRISNASIASSSIIVVVDEITLRVVQISLPNIWKSGATFMKRRNGYRHLANAHGVQRYEG